MKYDEIYGGKNKITRIIPYQPVPEDQSYTVNRHLAEILQSTPRKSRIWKGLQLFSPCTSAELEDTANSWGAALSPPQKSGSESTKCIYKHVSSNNHRIQQPTIHYINARLSGQEQPSHTAADSSSHFAHHCRKHLEFLAKSLDMSCNVLCSCMFLN